VPFDTLTTPRVPLNWIQDCLRQPDRSVRHPTFVEIPEFIFFHLFDAKASPAEVAEAG
jgi:hypothetical protein